MRLADYLDRLFCWNCGQGGRENWQATESSGAATYCFIGYRLKCKCCSRVFHISAKTVVAGKFTSINEARAEQTRATA